MESLCNFKPPSIVSAAGEEVSAQMLVVLSYMLTEYRSLIALPETHRTGEHSCRLTAVRRRPSRGRSSCKKIFLWINELKELSLLSTNQLDSNRALASNRLTSRFGIFARFLLNRIAWPLIAKFCLYHKALRSLHLLISYAANSCYVASRRPCNCVLFVRSNLG